jgi:hypothetical protein
VEFPGNIPWFSIKANLTGDHLFMCQFKVKPRSLFTLATAALLLTSAVVYVTLGFRNKPVQQQRDSDRSESINKTASNPDSSNNEELKGLKKEVAFLKAKLSALEKQQKPVPFNSRVDSYISNSWSKVAPDISGSNLLANAEPEDKAIILEVLQEKHELNIWWQAIRKFADNHNGQLPHSIEEAASYLNPGYISNLPLDNYEFPLFNMNTNVNLSSLASFEVIAKAKHSILLQHHRTLTLVLFSSGKIATAPGLTGPPDSSD